MPYGTGKFDSIENSLGGSVDLTQVTTSEATTSAKGYMSASDKTKIDGVEVGATADQTGAEIKAAYENEADTNVFTDAEKTKLSGVEENATSDQTGAEIKAAYEAEADTNAYTDAEKTKLAGIASGAIADAPSDGSQYARQDGGWVGIDAGSPTAVSGTAPSNPETGDLWFDTESARTFVYTGSEWADAAPDAGYPAAITSDTAPTDPVDGDLWFRTTDARMYVYYDDGATAQWVDANPANANARTYIGDTAPSNPVDGSLWWDSSDSNNLYVYYNDGSTAQWVPASITGGGADNVYLERSGTTLSPVSAGDSLDLGTGDLSAAKGTFSTGVLFGTDTAAANTLDDYEEGTFTPIIETAGSIHTYLSQVGRYTKIGNRCHIVISLQVDTNSNSGGASVFRMGALPFSGTQTSRFSISTYLVNFDATAHSIIGYLSSSDQVRVLYVRDNNTWDSATGNNFVFGSGAMIVVEGMYEVD